ncbi:hypothetical protein K2Q02_01025 [Patescibacteria group bacterium]|nr:hypothetical protein [Patescibacteria group bacterium]
MTHTTSTVTALEFSDSLIRMIRFTKKRKQMIPSEYVEIPIPRGEIHEGGIVNRKHITTVLSDLQKKYAIKHAFIVVPVETAAITASTIDTTIGVSTMSAAKKLLEQEGLLDQEQSIIARRVVAHTKHGRYLQVATAKKTLIEGFLSCCLDAHITPVSIEPVLQATLATIKEDDSLRPSMLVVIAEYRTTIAMVVNGQVVDTHIIEEGRQNLIAKQKKDIYTVSLSTAIQKYAIEWGNNKKQKGLFGSLQHIFLSGEGASLPEYADFLSATLRIPVSEINPWSKWFSFEDVIPILSRENSLRYIAVIGAALGRKEINLLPQHYVLRLRRKKITHTLKLLLLSFFLGAIAGGVVTAVLFFVDLLSYVTPVAAQLEHWIIHFPI